jgi:hypothetical protein
MRAKQKEPISIYISLSEPLKKELEITPNKTPIYVRLLIFSLFRLWQ